MDSWVRIAEYVRMLRRTCVGLKHRYLDLRSRSSHFTVLSSNAWLTSQFLTFVQNVVRQLLFIQLASRLSGQDTGYSSCTNYKLTSLTRLYGNYNHGESDIGISFVEPDGVDPPAG